MILSALLEAKGGDENRLIACCIQKRICCCTCTTMALRCKQCRVSHKASLQKRKSLRAKANSNISPSLEKRNVLLLPGDGIGPEIAQQGAIALKEAASQADKQEIEFTEKLIGGDAFDRHGDPLPDDTLNAAKASDGVLLAAIGGPQYDKNPKGKKPEDALLRIRAELGAFANLRPAIVLPELVQSSSLKREIVENTDLLVVRELTGGIYFGEPRGESNGRGYNTMVYSEEEVARIARVAFNAAMRRSGRVCSIDKANVLEVSQLWRRVVSQVHEQEFSQYTELSHMYVDNAAMQLVANPKQFDVMLASNIFGDILSDEAAMLTGSIGMLPSASVPEHGPGIFEPVHGSAPEIAGRDSANPLAMILSGAMLLRHQLGLERSASALENAVRAALQDGFRTADLQSDIGTRKVGCKEMGEAVVQRIERFANP